MTTPDMTPKAQLLVKIQEYASQMAAFGYDQAMYDQTGEEYIKRNAGKHTEAAAKLRKEIITAIEAMGL